MIIKTLKEGFEKRWENQSCKIGQTNLTGTCPASPALQDGAKGHDVEVNYLTGKLPPFRAESFNSEERRKKK